MQGEGLDAQPKSVARYTPHGPKFDATLDIMPEALAVPSLLDATILTCVTFDGLSTAAPPSFAHNPFRTFYLEYALDSARAEAELGGA